jgi:hypothetical protein
MPYCKQSPNETSFCVQSIYCNDKPIIKSAEYLCELLRGQMEWGIRQKDVHKREIEQWTRREQDNEHWLEMFLAKVRNHD